jgi:hypothetical protein
MPYPRRPSAPAPAVMSLISTIDLLFVTVSIISAQTLMIVVNYFLLVYMEGDFFPPASQYLNTGESLRQPRSQVFPFVPGFLPLTTGFYQ